MCPVLHPISRRRALISAIDLVIVLTSNAEGFATMVETGSGITVIF